MLVFVDESGDPGLKLNCGSSKYFVVTLVTFEEDDEANALDKRISLLKKHELRLRLDCEIKFNKCNKEVRKQFFSAVIPYNFFYFAIVINKEKLFGEGFKYKESFYKYTCSLVFENAKPYLREARVIIDGSGSKDFRKQLGSYLRKKVSGGFVKKIKLQDSKKNNLLQLTDMISGAIKRSFSEKHDAKIYRNIIKIREIYVQKWPR